MFVNHNHSYFGWFAGGEEVEQSLRGKGNRAAVWWWYECYNKIIYAAVFHTRMCWGSQTSTPTTSKHLSLKWNWCCKRLLLMLHNTISHKRKHQHNNDDNMAVDMLEKQNENDIKRYLRMEMIKQQRLWWKFARTFVCMRVCVLVYGVLMSGKYLSHAICFHLILCIVSGNVRICVCVCAWEIHYFCCIFTVHTSCA